MKWPVIAGAGVVGVLAAGSAWWLTHRSAPPRPAPPVAPVVSVPVPPPSTTGASVGPPRIEPPAPPVTAGVAPVPPAAGEPGAGSAFDDEAREPTWADQHERELALRLRAVEEDLEARGVQVQIGPPECRQTQCRVALAAADSRALGQLYDALESERGLRGWADSILLERVEADSEGRVETAVVTQFATAP